MFMSLVRSMLLTVLLSVLPFLAAAGSLDDYYLSQFDAHYGRHLQPVGGVSIQAADFHERCLTPLYHGLKRDWKQLVPETQKVLAKYLAKPTLSDPNPAFFTLPGGHFAIHYAKSGTDAPPLLDLNQNQIPDWVETVAATFENVYSVETDPGQMGYTAAPTLAGAPYDVYLKNMAPSGGVATAFGFTDTADQLSSTSFTSFITIDNDYSPAKYPNQITNYTPEKALQLTAAHEYHHAIQFSYNFYREDWYAEATSTWIEDEVYDGVNQLYNYLVNYMFNTAGSLDNFVSNPTANENITFGYGYGRWIFNRHLAEQHSPVIIRNIWEKLQAMGNANSNSDIPMIPVIDNVLKTNASSLGSDFFSFCKKLYVRNWTSHLNDITAAQPHPVAPVESYISYPVNSASSRVPGVTLSHYSFAYYSFKPSASAPQDLVLTISNRSPGITLAAFSKDLAGNVSEIAFDAATSTFNTPSFNAVTTSEVVLLVCNNSPTDTQSVGFSTDGTVIPIPPGGFPLLSPQQPTSPPVSSPASSGGGGGCFIATAAYGSYLHPKVKLLREFRDSCLLTNAPGRAFVAFYYKVSPSLADFIVRHDSLRRASRIMLTPLVFAVEYKGLVTVVLLIGIFAMAGGYLRSRPFM